MNKPKEARQSIPISITGVRGARSCPECGGRLVRLGMCFTCLSCGWGGCG